MIRGISDRATFTQLRDNGIQVRSRDLRLRFLDVSCAASQLRLAYAIPRRTGSAVTRNRIRRRLRSIVEECEGTEEQFPSGAAIFIVLPRCGDLTYQQLRNQVHELIKKLEISRLERR